MVTTFEKLLYSLLGTRISSVRFGKMTQKELSEALLARGVKMKRSSLANVEKGNQRVLLHSLYEIADILGCELSELLPSLEEVKGASAADPNEAQLQEWAREVSKRVNQ